MAVVQDSDGTEVVVGAYRLLEGEWGSCHSFGAKLVWAGRILSGLGVYPLTFGAANMTAVSWRRREGGDRRQLLEATCGLFSARPWLALYPCLSRLLMQRCGCGEDEQAQGQWLMCRARIHQAPSLCSSHGLSISRSRWLIDQRLCFLTCWA